MIVHHTGIASEKENRARGNPALKGAMQVEMMVLRNPDTGQVMLKQTKQKDLEPMPDMFFTLKKVDLPTVDEDGKVCSSVVPFCDEEERKPVDYQSIGANLLLRKMIKTAYEEKSEDIDIDTNDGGTIVRSNFLISVAKTFYHNRGVEPPYKGDYDLIKQDRKQSFVSMYLEGRVEQYTPGWWKVL